RAFAIYYPYSKIRAGFCKEKRLDVGFVSIMTGGPSALATPVGAATTGRDGTVMLKSTFLKPRLRHPDRSECTPRALSRRGCGLSVTRQRAVLNRSCAPPRGATLRAKARENSSARKLLPEHGCRALLIVEARDALADDADTRVAAFPECRPAACLLQAHVF